MKFKLNTALEVLERTPQILHSLLNNLSKDWIFSNEGDDTWSPFDIIGHLIHGEKTDWIPRMQIILSVSEDKVFKPFDRFAQFEHSKGEPLDKLLKEFELLRNKNLEILKHLDLTEDQLQLKGIHPELGEVSLSQLIASWVTHDLGHIAQISRVMAKQYKTEVGPWSTYIAIINK